MVLGGLFVAMLLLALPGGATRRARMRLGMAVVLLVTGADHLVNPWRYLPIMPDAVPWPHEVVLFTGLCEIAGGLGLLLARTRKAAGVMLALFFASVLPANVKAAAQGIQIVGLEAPNWAYWARLGLQPLLCWWALFAAGVLRWPAHEARPCDTTA